MDDGVVKPALRRFFGLTFLLSWSVGGAYLLARAFMPALQPLGDNVAVLVFMSCAPSAAALICASRQRTLHELWRSLVQPFNPVWLIVAFCILPMLASALIVTHRIIGVSWPVNLAMVGVQLPVLLFTTPQIVTNAGPLGEELGWRCYALPRLLLLTTPLRASLILGAVWSLWHVPAFFIGGLMAPTLDGFVWWCAGTVALTIVMTWLYVRTNGNGLVAGVIPHFVMNGAGALGVWLARPAEATLLLVTAIIIVLLGGLRRDGTPLASGRRR